MPYTPPSGDEANLAFTGQAVARPSGAHAHISPAYAMPDGSAAHFIFAGVAYSAPSGDAADFGQAAAEGVTGVGAVTLSELSAAGVGAHGVAGVGIGTLEGLMASGSGEHESPPAEGEASRAGFEMSSRVYIKRGRKIHIFDTVEDADAWEAAEAAAQEAIAKAKTRTAKRRIVRKVEAAIEHEVLRLDLLDALVARFNLKLDLPSIEARQDWAEYVRIAMLARELEDEEEIESLLLLM